MTSHQKGRVGLNILPMVAGLVVFLVRFADLMEDLASKRSRQANPV